MKKSMLKIVFATIVAATIMTSCNSSSDKLDEAKSSLETASENMDQAREDFAIQYHKFKTDSQEKIATNEHLIASLREYSKDMNKSAKEDYDRLIDEIEKRNQVMRNKVFNYKGEQNEAWESFKREFNHDMTEIENSLNDLGKNNVK